MPAHQSPPSRRRLARPALLTLQVAVTFPHFDKLLTVMADNSVPSPCARSTAPRAGVTSSTSPPAPSDQLRRDRHRPNKTCTRAVRPAQGTRAPAASARQDRLLTTARTRAKASQPRRRARPPRHRLGSHDRLIFTTGAPRPDQRQQSTPYCSVHFICNDFAHLVLSLLRHRDLPPARPPVFAPGLDPIDFHAVVQASVGRA